MVKLDFRVIDLNEQIEIIQDFLSLKDNTAKFIAESLGFKLEEVFAKNGEINQEKIKDAVSYAYNNRLKELNKKCEEFQKAWEKNSKFINIELIKIFGREFDFKCVAHVNLNPVWPRFLETKEFHAFIDSKGDEFLAFCVHEILHFIWFEIWKENFPDISQNDYDCPNLSWIISEIAIEPLFRFSNLKKLSKSMPAYDYFYTRKINDKTICQIANLIFKNSKNINEFQKKMYDFFKNHKEDCLL